MSNFHLTKRLLFLLEVKRKMMRMEVTGVVLVRRKVMIIEVKEQ